MTKTRQQTVEGHAEKMSDLLCVHQQELQSVRMQLTAQLKAKDQADREQIQALEARATVAQLSKGANGGTGGGEREQFEKFTATLKELKVSRDWTVRCQKDSR